MRTSGVIQKRSLRTARCSSDPRSFGSVAARHQAEISATKGASARSGSSASTQPLLLVAAQLFDLRERVVVESVGATQPLGEPLQPLGALLRAKRRLLGRWGRARDRTFHGSQ